MLISIKKYCKILVFSAFFAGAIIACQPENQQQKVVVYVSVDRTYAEPILTEFTAATGIDVLPVYDVEATKTTGLTQRLLREKSDPRRMCFGVENSPKSYCCKEREF